MKYTPQEDQALAHCTRGPHADTRRLELDRRLRNLWAQGRDTWPGLLVSPKAFVAHLSRGLPADSTVADALSAMSATNAPDLYLALGCLLGDARAIGFFESQFLGQVRTFVAGRMPDALVDELLQTLREKLLVGRRGSPPKLAQYNGQGPLGAWLRAVALRAATNVTKLEARQRRSRADDVAAPVPTPETSYVNALQRAGFREALRGALASLPSENREALRLHYLEGLTLQQIAIAWRISRSKVARLVAVSRRKVLLKTREELSARLRVDANEIGSLLASAEDAMSVTISGVLSDLGEKDVEPRVTS